MSRYIKAFTVVFLGVVLFVVGFGYLKSGGIFTFSNVYYATYDNVKGLMENAPVDFNGYKVGNVRTIEFLPDGRLVVGFSINEDINLYNTAVAHLSDDGIIGSKTISIIHNNPDGDILKHNDTLRSSVAGSIREMLSKRLDSFMDNLNQTFKSADSVFVKFNRVLNETTQSNLVETVKTFHNVSKNLKNITTSIDSILLKNSHYVSEIFTNTAKASDRLASFSDAVDPQNIKKVMLSMIDISKKLESVLKKIDSREGTAGKLIDDPTLYNSMRDAGDELKELARDIKLHPKRYFSLRRKEIPYKRE